ncbi:ATP-dependent DNA helicase PIF1-like protein [Tanacetum coccineum]
MNTGNNSVENHSLANKLCISLMIHSNIIVSRDGRVQSYCGLRLTGIPTSIPGPSLTLDQDRTNVNQRITASTSINPCSQSQKRKEKKSPKGAALASTGDDVSYHSLGPLSYECFHCHATMWYEERSDKARKHVNPSFSLCCQDGGPRYMMQNYQDAMAICRTYGNPDMFITFTSNPKWSEISSMIAHVPGQKAHD